jgi:putative ABC transport system permease protein
MAGRTLKANSLLLEIRRMDEVLSRSVARPGFTAFMLASFAGMAFVLAIVGVYGALSYSVSQRTHEMGVRLVLGAKPRQIVNLVLAQGLAVTLTRVLAGLAASVGVTHLRQPFSTAQAPRTP